MLGYRKVSITQKSYEGKSVKQCVLYFWVQLPLHSFLTHCCLIENIFQLSFVTAKISLPTSVHTQHHHFMCADGGEIMAIQYSVNNIKILHTHFLCLQAASARYTYRQRDDSHIIRFHYPGKSGETYDLITLQRCLASLVFNSSGTM